MDRGSVTELQNYNKTVFHTCKSYLWRIKKYNCPPLLTILFFGQRPQGADVLYDTGVNFQTSERAYLRPLWQLSMLFNRNFAFFQFLVNLPCYSMGILHFSQFSSIFYVIQWEVCILSISHVIQWEFEAWEASGGTDGRTDGRTDGWTYIRTDVWKFTPVSYRTSALWGRCPKRIEERG